MQDVEMYEYVVLTIKIMSRSRRATYAGLID